MSEAVVIVEEGDGPIVATAIHDGHALRAEVAAMTALDDAARLREEDPLTGRIAARVPTRLVATRSRFEVDLNRPRDTAVYVAKDDCWGLDAWCRPLPPDVRERSLAVYDEFYATLERVLRDREKRYGRFVVLDVHSYNHCRDGVGCAADPEANPEVNVGTGTVAERWRPLVDRFERELAACGLDVRENVKFKGGYMSRWIHERFPQTGCCLALEFKKTFMDEWTGIADDAHVARLAAALATTLPGLVVKTLAAEVLANRPPPPSLAIELTGSAAQAEVAAPAIARALEHLLDNAYAFAKSKVAVEIGVREGRAQITVRDDGPGVPADLVPKLFDRFASRRPGGTGLGLAYVRAVAEAHGGAARCNPAPSAAFVIELA